MKKQIIIFFLFFIPILVTAQKGKKIKITTQCNDKFVNEYAGIWLPQEYYLTKAGLNKSQQQEWTNRFNGFFNWIKEIYPTPIGSDGYWNCHATKSSFANQVKFSDDGGVEPIKTNPILTFDFDLALYTYYCDGTPNTIGNGFPDPEMSNCGLFINMNSLNEILIDASFSTDNHWRIDGRPIKLKLPVIGKWKGYDVLKLYGGSLKDQSSQKYVLLTRPGILPYTPVTRKQYLDIAIPYITKFYDDEIRDADNISIKQDAERKKNIMLKSKNDALKKYQDVLEESTKKGLLESPAIIAQGGVVIMMSDQPVFTTEEEGGNMLVTQNPNYFRKDLPVTAPQFILITWWWGDGNPWRMRFKNAIEENFPIENLQAMIDK